MNEQPPSTLRPPVGFAIVGTGAIARVHAQAIAGCPGAELRAVYSRTRDRAETFAREHGVGVARSLDDLLARPDIEAVCVTTPTGSHGEIAIPALTAGKHVLCEKPLEINLERADAIITAAERHNRWLAAIFQSRFGLGARTLKQAITAGRFGRLTVCTAQVKWWRSAAYYENAAWRGTWRWDGGGALMNQGIHAVDLLQWLTGLPVEVAAFAGTLVHPRLQAEDTLVANLRYANGTLGAIECTTASFPGQARRIEVTGEAGTAILVDDAIKVWEFATPAAEDDRIRAGGATSGLKSGASDPKALSLLGHRLQIEDLVRAIRESLPPAIPGREARNAIRLIQAIYDSAGEGGTTRIV